MLTFLVAYIFYWDGSQTVITQAANFFTEVLLLDQQSIIIVFLVVQFVAYFGAVFASILSKKIGVKNTIIITSLLFFLAGNAAAFESIIPEKFYDYVDIITPNEIEAEYLSGISITSLEEAKKSAEYISSLGPKNVIITLADKGSWVQSEDFVGHIKSYEVNVLASVAAGDAFNGALASSLSTGSSLFSSVKFASAAAALSVSRKGAQESMPYLHEIQELMN